MPTSSPSFAGMTVFALIVVVLLAAAIIVMFKERNAAIIRRSQYEMLLLMLFGGFFTTGAAIAYAGRPTRFLCGIRPILICMWFTTIFGSFVIKSLRVYRVFMKSAMKRVKVTLSRILKILSIFYIGDIIIISNLTNISETANNIPTDAPRKGSQKYQIKPSSNTTHNIN